MNVLVFVTSMLLLFAILTLGRLESFRNFTFVQAAFKQYMRQTERQYVNNETTKRYKKTVATKGTRGKQERNQGSPTLSFELFVDAEARAAEPAALKNHRKVAVDLMAFLYKDQPFFQEAKEMRPNFLNEIIDALIRKTETFTKKEKFKAEEEISTIDLKDEVLNEVFTKMLAGTVKKQGEQQSPPFKPEEGYYSLLDFITIQSNKLKIRVFLASPQLLMALYGNPEVVENILSERYRLFLQVDKNAREAPDAGEEFENAFQGQAIVPGSMLDFGVSKTNPLQYE
jgi:hypothetical protein